MQQELILGGIKIPLYGLMIALGVLFLVLIVLHLFYKSGASDKRIDQLVIITAASGAMLALGAHFFDSLWDSIAQYKISGEFKWIPSGITFSGGLLSAFVTYVIVYYIFSKTERHKMFYYLDFIVIGIAIAHGFGRIGCFFGGCCHGGEAPIGTPFTMFYNSEFGWANVYLTSLYEAFFLLLLAMVLLFVIKKNRCGWYFIIYNIYRFFIEYLRGDERGASPFGFLTPSQFLAVIMIIIGIVLIVFRKQLESLLKRANAYLVEETRVEVNELATVYENKCLNFLHHNKQIIAIMILFIFTLTIVTFGIVRNGKTNYSSIKQIKENISEVNDEWTWKTTDDKKIVISKNINDEDKLVFSSIYDDYLFEYYPEESLIVVSNNGDDITYKADYLYIYHISKDETRGFIKNFSAIDISNSNVVNGLNGTVTTNARYFATMVALCMSENTTSIVPIIFIILISLEFIILIGYLVLIYFDKRFNLLNSKYLKELKEAKNE